MIKDGEKTREKLRGFERRYCTGGRKQQNCKKNGAEKRQKHGHTANWNGCEALISPELCTVPDVMIRNCTQEANLTRIFTRRRLNEGRRQHPFGNGICHNINLHFAENDIGLAVQCGEDRVCALMDISDSDAENLTGGREESHQYRTRFRRN